MPPRPTSAAAPLLSRRGWHPTLRLQLLAVYKPRPLSTTHLCQLRSSAAPWKIVRPRSCTNHGSLDLALALRGIEVLAARNNGQDALQTLQSLTDRDGYTMVLKGIRCLQAYHDRISPFSVEVAQKAVAADDAGGIVHSWVCQPHVQKEIESNHEGNELLLSLVSYILVGAGKASIIDTWIKKYRPIQRRRSSKHYMSYKWTDLMRQNLTQALIAWDPSGLADPGYDYFSKEFEDYWFKIGHLGDTFHHNTTSAPWLWTTSSLDHKYARLQYPASSKSYERCVNNLIAYQTLFRPEFRPLLIAVYAMNHPNHPSADPFLSFCEELSCDLYHPVRFLHCKSKVINKTQRWFRALGEFAKEILNKQKRHKEAEFVHRVIYGIWGREIQGRHRTISYEERRREWEQRNQEAVRNKWPKFYVPYDF